MFQGRLPKHSTMSEAMRVWRDHEKRHERLATSHDGPNAWIKEVMGVAPCHGPRHARQKNLAHREVACRRVIEGAAREHGRDRLREDCDGVPVVLWPPPRSPFSWRQVDTQKERARCVHSVPSFSSSSRVTSEQVEVTCQALTSCDGASGRGSRGARTWGAGHQLARCRWMLADTHRRG